MAAEKKLDQNTFAGFTLLEHLGSGSQSSVYRTQLNGRDAAIKIQSKGQSLDNAIKNYRREAALLRRVNHPSVPKVMSLGAHDGVAYQIQEMTTGKPLSEVLIEGRISIETTLRIGINIASALSEIHNQGYLHRDIKPQNIIVSEENIKIIDFGAYTEDLTKSADQIIGTPLYCSPEQAGMLSRPTDIRSDMYSLGVVLYECIAGHPPFQGSDITKIIEMHATQAVPKLDVTEKKSVHLARVIEQLLKKEPDERYQCSRALVYDLESILNDTFSEPNYLQTFERKRTLVGRETETKRLDMIWDNLHNSKSGTLLFVRGAPGIGKSRLLQNFWKVKKVTHLIHAKAVKNNETSLYAVKVSLDDFVLQQSTSEGEEKIRRAAGNLAPYVATVSYRLRKILGLNENSRIGDPEQFYQAIAQFMANLTNEFQGLHFYFDDYQWIDGGSRQIIQHLGQHLANKNFLLAISSRLETTVQDVSKLKDSLPKNIHVDSFEVAGLNQQGSKDLCSYLLSTNASIEGFDEKVFSLTEGNPYSIEEYIRVMINEGALTPNIQGGWDFNASTLESIDLPKNVIDLALKRIDNILPLDRQVLSLAALCGNRLDCDLISQAIGVKVKDVLTVCQRQHQNNVLELGESNYTFVHDRMREAFLASLDEDTAKQFNDKIFLAMELKYKESMDEHIGQIAYHAYNGTQKNQQKVYDYNFRAGQKALDNFSIELCRELLGNALKVSESNGITADWRLFRALADVHNLSHDISQAQEYYRKSIEICDDKIEIANMYTEIGLFGLLNIDRVQKEEGLREGFKALGMKPPRPGPISFMVLMFNLLRELALGALKVSLNDEDLRVRKTLHRLYALSFWKEYFSVTHGLTHPPFIVFNMFQNAYRLKYDAFEKSDVYSFLSMLMSMLRVEPLARFFVNYGEAKTLATNNPINHANFVQAYVMFGQLFGLPNRQDSLHTIFWDKRKWITSSRFTITLSHYVWGLSLRGKFQQSIQTFESALEKFRPHEIGHYLQKAAPAMAALGQIERARKVMETENIPEERWGLLRSFNHRYVWVHFLFEIQIFDKELLEKLKVTFIEKLWFLSLAVYDHFFVIRSYAWLYFLQKEPVNKKYLKALKNSLKWVRIVSLYNREARPHSSVLKAGILVHEGKLNSALDLLEKVEARSESLDSDLLQYEICRLRARIFLQRGKTIDIRMAQFWFATAMSIAKSGGWQRRMAHLRQEFKGLEDSTSKTRFSTNGMGLSMVASDTNLLTRTAASSSGVHMKRILDSVLTITESMGEIDPKKQAGEILDCFITLFGAERAYLMEVKDGRISCFAGRLREQKNSEAPAGFSSTVIKRAYDESQPILITGNNDGEVHLSESIVANDLKSILAGPVIEGDETLAVVYLDNSIVKGVFGEDDLGLFSTLCKQISVSIKMSRAAQLKIEKAEAEKNLEVTGAVQNLIIPQERHFSSEKFDFYAHFEPCSICGGDWVWFEEAKPGKYFFIVSDLTGHGPGPAMLTTAMASAYQTWLSLQKSDDFDLAGLMTVMNNSLFNIARNRYTMTCFAGVLDAESSTLTYASAAHNPPLLCQGPGEEVGWKEVDALATSMSSLMGDKLGNKFAIQSTVLNPGDNLIVFTDGIVEGSNPAGTMWGDRRMKRSLKGGPVTTERMVKSVVQSARSFYEGVPLDDDMTILAIKRKR